MVAPSPAARTIHAVKLKTSGQHHKGRKRPRAWHRGRGAGQAQAPALKALKRAEKRAAELEAELVPIRIEGALDTAAWRQLDRVSPFVPSLLPDGILGS